MIQYYPGWPLWWKRILHTIVICSIGVNIFLNKVNDLLFTKAEELVQVTNSLLPSASKVAKSLDENILPAIKYIESSKLSWVIDSYRLPSSKSLEFEIGNISKLEKACYSYQSIFSVAYSILSLTNILMWWPIIFSMKWLYQDLKRGPAKVVSVSCWMVGIVVNILTYNYLNVYWTFIDQ